MTITIFSISFSIIFEQWHNPIENIPLKYHLNDLCQIGQCQIGSVHFQPNELSPFIEKNAKTETTNKTHPTYVFHDYELIYTYNAIIHWAAIERKTNYTLK